MSTNERPAHKNAGNDETEEAESQSEAADYAASDLTQFQINILAVLAEEPRYGLAVKRGLENYYNEDINHGRLYPNLDDLVEEGYVEKSELDKRTNEYALTPDGLSVLNGRLQWIANKHGYDLIPAEADDE